MAQNLRRYPFSRVCMVKGPSHHCGGVRILSNWARLRVSVPLEEESYVSFFGAYVPNRGNVGTSPSLTVPRRAHHLMNDQRSDARWTSTRASVRASRHDLWWAALERQTEAQRNPTGEGVASRGERGPGRFGADVRPGHPACCWWSSRSASVVKLERG